MIDNNIKRFYYDIKHEMNNYITYSGKNYKIVGFRYINEHILGYFVIDVDGDGYYYDEIESNWPGINRILLSLKDKIKYTYYYIPKVFEKKLI